MRITFVNGTARKKPRIGDVRIHKGVTQVRRWKRCSGGYEVSNGRHLYEWVNQ